LQNGATEGFECNGDVKPNTLGNLVAMSTDGYIHLSMKRSLFLSVTLGAILAVALWFTLEASDEIFQSRLMWWVVPLIRVQEAGFRAASRLFPCQREGFDTGCEAYKKLPVFLGANAIVYSICLLPVVGLVRRRRRP
jgi:hypothetical protein